MNVSTFKNETTARKFAVKIDGKSVPAVGGGFLVVKADLHVKRTRRYSIHGTGGSVATFGNTTNPRWAGLVGGAAPLVK